MLLILVCVAHIQQQRLLAFHHSCLFGADETLFNIIKKVAMPESMDTYTHTSASLREELPGI